MPDVIKCPKCKSTDITVEGMVRCVYSQTSRGTWELVEREYPRGRDVNYSCDNCDHEWEED